MNKITQNQNISCQNNCNLFQKPFLLFVNCFLLLFFSSISFAQSSTCQGTLIVENNSYVRSAPLSGTFYSMVLTNTGNKSDTYSLSSSNVNSSSSNPDRSTVTNNVAIKATFMDLQKNVISSIALAAGKSINFFVSIEVPVGTTINKWNSTQISAKSANCNTYQLDTILHTLVIDASND